MKKDYSHLPILQRLYDHYDQNNWDTLDQDNMLVLLTGFLSLRQQKKINFYVRLPSGFGARLRVFCSGNQDYYLKVRQILFCHNAWVEAEGQGILAEWLWERGEAFLVAKNYSTLEFAEKERI